jgi:predicted Zn-dependent peptidase
MQRQATIALLFFCALCGRAARGQDVASEKYQLSNGMTVILHEDHSLPLACINTWFHVGSKDEAPGRSGFAHLFEHLMFMGTRRVPDNQFDVLMESGGGFNNASTAQDRTNYFSFGPSSLLPTLLWLDADRLEDLGQAMTQEKLDKQREVVRNERRQTSEMQPYGKAELKITELMFPPGHPYHIEVIGTHADLQAATLRDVKDFFAAYYLPNNASLVVAGDFDPKAIKPLIEKLFGSLPRGPEAAHRKADPVRLDEVRRVAYADQVQFPRLTLVYHSPASFTPGDAEMDLAADILSDGKSSRLYERFVYEDKLATEVSARQNSMMLGSLFQIDVTARQGVSLDTIEKAADEVIAEFIRQGPTQQELEKHKAKIEYQAISQLQSLLAKADALNRYNFYYGEPNSFKRDLDRYRNATVGGVRDWARRVLTPAARLIMRVLPEESAESPRDRAPEALATKEFSPQMPESFTLSNGIEVRHWRRKDLPLIHVSLLLRGGAAKDDPGQGGLTSLTANMLDEGAGKLGAMEFADALKQLGATVTTDVNHESASVDLSVLRRNFSKALGLFADAVLRPRMEEKEWDRVKTLHIQTLKQAEDRPASVASRVGMKTFFGDAHAYGRPAEGTVDSVGGLTVDAIRLCHRERITPERAVFLVAGDLTGQEARALLEKSFGKWKSARPTTSSASTPKPESPAATSTPRVVLVDKPGAVQTVIRFFMPAPPYSSPDRIKLECLNTILGGSFTSRLNQNLREKHGYTYGARSSFVLRPSTGYFTAGADVQAEHTGAALKEFLSEFGKLRGGDVSANEAEKTRRTNRMDLIQSFQSLSGLLAAARQIEENGSAFETLNDDLASMDAVTQQGLNGLAPSAIPLEQSVLVLVGDKKLILDQLKSLPLQTPIELNVSGDPKAD